MPTRPQQAQFDYIAANVRRLRLRLGLTQEGLADKAGLEPRFVQRVERAKVDLRVSTFLRLAGALEAPPAALLRRAKLEPATPGRPFARDSRTAPRRRVRVR